MNRQKTLRHPALILVMLAVMVCFQLPAFSQDDTELPSDQEAADDSSSSSSDSSSASSSDSSSAASTAGDDSSTTAAASSSGGSSSSTSSASDTGKKLADVFKNIISIIQQVFDIFSKLIQAIFGGGTAATGTGTTGTTTGTAGTTGTTGTTGTAGTTGSTDTGTTGDSGTTAAAGDLPNKVAAEAAKLANKPFKYAAGTDGGRKGCAQVVTTALKAAGAVSRVVLGVLDAISDLKARGWKEVQVPPFAKGDVITWKTYDRSGDGVKDADTHIGIIVTSGNSAQAMSNSSSLLMPRYNSATYQPISRVLRKA